MFTNREASALVAIRSVVAHAAQLATVHVVVDDAACCPEILLLAARSNPRLRLRVYTLGELTLELLADGHRPFWAALGGGGDDGEYWVRPGAWDSDPKHATPLNHAWFYLADFRFAAPLRRLLFIDDDVVVQADVSHALSLRMARSAALAVSCNAITFDKACGFFHLSWNRVAYRETSYFSWRPFEGDNVSAAECDDTGGGGGGDAECIARGGFDLLQSAAVRIGGAAIDWSHFAWNYGFVVVDLPAWRRLRLTARYEAWVDENALRRIFPPTSIGFGLGLPFLVLAGAVQCLDRSALRIAEGLAVLNGDDMALNGLDGAHLATAHVLHYTGELKPWLPDALPEFAAPYARYDASAARAAPDAPRRLFVLLGGEHAGAEWALSVLDAHPALCAAGQAKGALHALRAFSRDALAPLSDADAAGALDDDWQAKCSRQALCSWRHFAFAVTAPEGHPGLAGYAQQRQLPAWRAWWADPVRVGDHTALLTAFLKAAAIGGAASDGSGDRLMLPCACPRRSAALGFKFLADWLAPAGGFSPPRGQLAAYDALHSGPSALEALSRVNATLIVWERADPADAYLSMLKSVASGQWHCPSSNCVPPAAQPLHVNVSACRDYVSWYRATTRRLDELLEAHALRHTRFVYEDCLADQAACMARLARLLGVEPHDALPRAPQRVPEDAAAVFQNWHAPINAQRHYSHIHLSARRELVRRECSRPS